MTFPTSEFACSECEDTGSRKLYPLTRENTSGSEVWVSTICECKKPRSNSDP